MAVADLLHVIGVKFHRRHIRQRFGRGDQVLVPVAGLEGLLQFSQGRGVAQAEASALGAAQSHEIGARAEGVAHVIGQRTDIRPAGAMHIHHDFGQRPFQHFQVMHLDLARGQFHCLALARHVVGAASAHFHGGVRRGRLLDLALELLEDGLELLLGHIDRRVRADEFSVRVERVGAGAESDDGLVAFVRSGNVLAQAHGRADQDDKHTGSARVERASVSGAADACPAADGFHHVVRGHADGFIHHEDAGDGVLYVLTVH